MERQLQAVVTELEAAGQRLHALHADLSRDEWCARPAARAWSAAECVAHLNLTSQALLPLLRDGLRDARDRGAVPSSSYRRDPVGWLLWKLIAPAGGLKTRTVPKFVPSGMASAEHLVAEFDRLQADIIACVRAADGLPIDRVRLVSPFDARVRYNLFAALTLVPRHQHRHLLQAERASRVSAPLASAVTI